MNERERIYLSPPHMGEAERGLMLEAFDSNWIAPLGPHVDAFEREFAEAVGAPHAAALSSGTAALHLALLLLGVQKGDVVLVSSFTFAASVNPILYEGATPHFIDSERESWNMDPARLEEALVGYAARGRLPRAVIVVHLYGQSANLSPIVELCERYGVPIIEDAAEALGARYGDRAPGTLGAFGIYSFNGNKIITTSGGGMLVSSNGEAIARARKLASQARERAPHYEHEEVGYNYRLSNLLAAVGRGQLSVLEDRVRARRRNFKAYANALGALPGVGFMPEATWGRHTRWLTCLTLDSDAFGADTEAVQRALEAQNIEARPLWKPMHLQPVFSRFPATGGAVCEDLFARGLCLPSGSSLEGADIARVVEVVREVHAKGATA